MLSVTTEAANYDRALDILEADGAVDIDERERTWQSEGWTGWQEGIDPIAGSAHRPDNSTAGFGASAAGEDGYEPPQPRDVERAETGSLTAAGTDDAESRADPSRVGTGAGIPGTMNPDMRERIGAGIAGIALSEPEQGRGAEGDAASYDRKAAIEEASLGAPTRSGMEAPRTTSTVGSTDQDGEDLADPWTSQRDATVQRARVRGFILPNR